VVLTCTVMFCLIGTLKGHLPEYSPFPAGSRPKQFPVRELAQLGEEVHPLDLAEKGRTRQSRNPIARITWLRNKAGLDAGVALTMLSWDRKQIAGPFHVSSSPVTPYGHTADINRDGNLDYILKVHFGAVGAIGGGVNDVVFAISEKATYRIYMIPGLYPDTNDFLDTNGDGGFQFLNMSFVPTEPLRGKDGKSHNYWVYNLFKVEGSELRLDNSVISGFPKWILYTFRANHVETDQLTEAQKRQLLNPDEVCWISTPDKPCPGFFRE
jgi:hypothetical protein